MTKIVNPLYDSAFKYLMEDNKVAKVLLGALMDREIKTVETKHQEVSVKQEDGKLGPRIFRMDFAAKVRNADGKEELVTIELQKARLQSEVMRFRKYLASQNSDQSNVTMDKETKIVTPRHIVAIYILGHNIEETDEPITRYYCKGENQFGEVLSLKNAKRPFVSGLTHDVIIVQVRRLQGRMRTRAERIMSLFDLNEKGKDEMYVDYAGMAAEDKDVDVVLRRLQSAVAEQQLRINMEAEDLYAMDVEYAERVKEDLEEAKRGLEEAKQEKARAEQEKKKAEQEKMKAEQEKKKAEQEKKKAEQEKVKAEQEKKKAEQEKARVEQEKVKAEQEKEETMKSLAVAIKALHATGKNVDEIVGMLNVKREVVESIIGKQNA